MVRATGPVRKRPVSQRRGASDAPGAFSRFEDTMNLKTHTWVTALVGISVFTTTVSLSSAHGIQDGQSAATATANARTIPGVWRTVVTPYNCQTGQPILTLSG